MLIELTFFTPDGYPTEPVYTTGPNPVQVIDSLGRWTITVTQNGVPFTNEVTLALMGGADGVVALLRRTSTCTAMIDGRVACIARPAFTLS